jgi:ATP-dependent RNA helicase UAP56/SUB2
VLSTLQQIEADDFVNTLVLCHTRELAYQICQEFNRFKKYLPGIKVSVLYGGHPIRDHRRMLKEETPQIVVGTPGRVLALIKEGNLKVDKLKRFIMDECDSLLQSLGMCFGEWIFSEL